MSKSLSSSLPGLSETEFWEDYPNQKILALVRDFTDEELVKLSVLHFCSQVNRPKEETVQAMRELQETLYEFAADREFEAPLNRLFVAEIMFEVIGQTILGKA